jgi:hypothetical protein
MEECFYKITVTQDSKQEVYHFGYMPYKDIMIDVEKFYSEGADAVVMEMINQAQFDKRMEPYQDQYSWEQHQLKLKKKRKQK